MYQHRIIHTSLHDVLIYLVVAAAVYSRVQVINVYLGSLYLYAMQYSYMSWFPPVCVQPMKGLLTVSSSIFMFVYCESLSTLCAEYEAGMIRLIDKVTNGSKIEINQTGEQIKCTCIACFFFCFNVNG